MSTTKATYQVLDFFTRLRQAPQNLVVFFLGGRKTAVQLPQVFKLSLGLGKFAFTFGEFTSEAAVCFLKDLLTRCRRR